MTGRWFLVQEMLEALRAFAETFEFRFDLLPESDVLRAVDSPMGKSLIHSTVLQVRQYAHEPPPRQSARLPASSRIMVK